MHCFSLIAVTKFDSGGSGPSHVGTIGISNDLYLHWKPADAGVKAVQLQAQKFMKCQFDMDAQQDFVKPQKTY